MMRLFMTITFVLTCEEIMKSFMYYERELPEPKIPLYWDFGTIH